MARSHEASFERGVLARHHSLRELASLLKRTLRRIRTVTEDFHMVLHTTPNTMHKSDVLDYWRTIDDDYHWHIEILPILAKKAKSYTFKEVYFTPVTSETAAARLRDASVA
jgi:UDPglucose--hexose-1-phosphate uridylyltransferase